MRVLGADLHRRAQPVVGVGRRHLDVDDRHVGAVGPTLRRRSTASPAWPTTSKPASSSSRLRPLRKSSWSSPMTTRMRSPTSASPRRPHRSAAPTARRSGSSPAPPWGRSRSAPERRSREPTRSSSSAEVRTTRGGGCSSPSAAATAKPSMSGRWTSSSTASGRSRRHGGERGHAVVGLADDRIAALLEQRPRQLPEPGVVVDDEDGSDHGSTWCQRASRSTVRLPGGTAGPGRMAVAARKIVASC